MQRHIPLTHNSVTTLTFTFCSTDVSEACSLTSFTGLLGGLTSESSDSESLASGTINEKPMSYRNTLSRNLIIANVPSDPLEELLDPDESLSSKQWSSMRKSLSSELSPRSSISSNVSEGLILLFELRSTGKQK